MNGTRSVEVVLLEADRVLLVRRRDLPLWSLPGGGVEPPETDEAAALREAREETGLELRIVGRVGEYRRRLTRRGVPDRATVFLVARLGGRLATRTPETREARTFPAARLPRTLVPWDRVRIADAVSGRRDGLVEQAAGAADLLVVTLARLGERLAGRPWGPR